VAFALTHAPLEAEVVRQAVLGPGNGAVILFHGSVRNQTAERRVTHLEYEAYEPMALAALERLGREMIAAHDISAIAGAHRLGRVEVGEDALLVAVAAPHRAAALAALAEFIERLKQEVPIWKKEHFEGGAVWIGTPQDPQGRGAAPPPGEPPA